MELTRTNYVFVKKRIKVNGAPSVIEILAQPGIVVYNMNPY